MGCMVYSNANTPYRTEDIKGLLGTIGSARTPTIMVNLDHRGCLGFQAHQLTLVPQNYMKPIFINQVTDHNN
jgi:hypothetical protein